MAQDVASAIYSMALDGSSTLVKGTVTDLTVHTKVGNLRHCTTYRVGRTAAGGLVAQVISHRWVC
jgi:hypothetical protein